MYYIYRITNKVDGKTYIGQHKYKKLNDKYMGSGVLIAKAKKKYGIENFKKEILEFDIPDVDLANDWEQMYILFERVKGKAEYNIANGGYGNKGFHHSEETRRKMSKTRKGHKVSEETRRKLSEANKGKIISEEQRKKHSELLKGRQLSEETKRKISEANKGKNKPMRSEEHRKHLSETHKGINHPNYGKHRSEETKRKISEAHKGKCLSEEHRKKLSESHKGKHYKIIDGKRVWY